ncbi:TBC1 domain family member 13-like isoform X1 [Haliotis rubra]|uniref:TBC1 domain family member 13-like isoform X1 n=1 Tax=Haliotis rubra TaxID=36100 RepID=UPI001EE4F265|nr:TBC1 domain family member 13-like isoform X1 [Haliotis rubra]
MEKIIRKIKAGFSYRPGIREFEELLKSDEIDFKNLRKLCFAGCPFESGSGIRSVCWKILLNYLPLKRGGWPDFLKKQRALYRQFVQEMIIDPGRKANAGVHEDHPLNPNPDSSWQAIFKDNDMLVQIDKDCRRLCPDLFFFQRATDYPHEDIVNCDSNIETLRKRVEQCVLHSETVSRNRLGITNMMSSRRKSSEEYAALPEGQEAHWEVVERILFIYAKLNPGLKYVQGMNEILGPIYYTFASDPDVDCREYAEADSFFCFTNLMAEIRDNFIKTLDDSQCGIGNLMMKLYNYLQVKDPALWHLLKEQDLKPQYYAFRWLTLLLSQEFPLPDVLRIWDSLFADASRFEFLIHVSCAMLMLLREDLLKSDFPHNMKLLQNFPPSIDVQTVLAKAVEVKDRHQGL